ncbi:single-stranded DNA-binding protein [Kitasatospora paranensis]
MSGDSRTVFHVKHRASTAELLFREVITTMAGETVITLVGNLVDDPELRFTPSGAAVAKFRIASTPRTFDRQTNEWKDGESLFLTCNVWRQPAENVAESLQRGMRVIVQGRLRQRSYETKEGEKRTVFEVEVDEVGPSLRSATAKVTRANRSGAPGGGGGGFNGQQGGAPSGGGWGGGQQGGGGGNWGGNSGGQSGPSDDPWASSAPSGGNQGGGGWGAPSGGGFSEEPPF